MLIPLLRQHGILAVARSKSAKVIMPRSNWRQLLLKPSGSLRQLTSTTVNLKKGVSKKEEFSFDDLPSHIIDSEGNKSKPLEAWDDGSKIKSLARKPKKSNSGRSASPGVGGEKEPISDNEAYRRAVEAGEIPSSPLSKEVFLTRRRFPDCIVLTRVGKFYESYFAPAIQFSKLLGLKLAYKRYAEGQLFPFSGFPITQLDKYLKILVQDLGHTVVLVEEYDEHGNKESLDPIRKKLGGGDLKERKVGRVVTPGTLVDESWLSGDESRYLLAVAIAEGTPGSREDTGLQLSLAYTDASTGEFFLKNTNLENVEDELARISPSEIVLPSTFKDVWESVSAEEDTKKPVGELLNLLRIIGIHVSFAEPKTRTSGNTSLEQLAISLLRTHLEYALRDEMPDLNNPIRQSSSSMMQVDAATIHALEIRHSLRSISTGETYARGSPISVRGTLLSVISKTVTPGGHRLLIRTLTAPSTKIPEINKRLDLVEAFTVREELRLEIQDMIRNIGDVMRLIQRFRGRRGDGRDAWEVGRWIRGVGKVVDRIKEEVEYELQRKSESSKVDVGRERLPGFIKSFEPVHELAQKLEESLDEAKIMRGITEEDNEDMEQAGDAMLVAEEKPKTKKDNEARREALARDKEEKEDAQWWMKPDFSPALREEHDKLNALKAEKIKMQEKLRKEFDIPSLTLTKMRNSFVATVIKKSDYAKIDKTRRFTSIFEGRSAKSWALNSWSALGAKMEKQVEELYFAQRLAFRDLRDLIVEFANAIQVNAEMIGELDLAMGFAQVAVEHNYVRPILNDSTEMHVVNGRHPTVESSLLNTSRSFTPNTTDLSPSSHLHIITGPNQGGKSTLLRQTAIIAILAQSGCFVPADRVEMGIVDRVFSRVGARDDLYRDRSTFMLEMVETSAILRHATPRSLVIMDEIGRGTTLNSGLSIAYATLDYILHHIKCRTLFATHYHELAEMLEAETKKTRDGVAFWCTDVDEYDGAFSFSYRLRPGINHRSHAIKAARMAGMPDSFLAVAEKTLSRLDAKQLSSSSTIGTVSTRTPHPAGTKTFSTP